LRRVFGEYLVAAQCGARGEVRQLRRCDRSRLLETSGGAIVVVGPRGEYVEVYVARLGRGGHDDRGKCGGGRGRAGGRGTIDAGRCHHSRRVILVGGERDSGEYQCRYNRDGSGGAIDVLASAA